LRINRGYNLSLNPRGFYLLKFSCGWMWRKNIIIKQLTVDFCFIVLDRRWYLFLKKFFPCFFPLLCNIFLDSRVKICYWGGDDHAKWNHLLTTFFVSSYPASIKIAPIKASKVASRMLSLFSSFFSPFVILINCSIPRF